MTAATTPNNFLGLPEEFSGYERSQTVILPIPFDKTCSWLQGTSNGPRAIIDASRNLELYDIETKSEPYRQGIHTLAPVSGDDSLTMNEAVHSRVRELLADGKFVVSLGGEHSVSFGTIKAHAEKHKYLSVLQLDAHTDLRDSYEGNPFSHASVMARAKEVVDRVVAVGIRSMDRNELVHVVPDNIFYAEVIREEPSWVREVVDRLTDNVYITLDVDVFDIGIMPSTGTPEPGGLSWYDVISLFKAVAQKKKIVGFDVVELMPSESNRAPDFMTAKVIYKLLAYRGKA